MLVTLRDMQWRARRISIGVAATGLVLAVAALLGALHEAFLDETDRTIALFGADRWVVPADVAGPFTSNTPLRTTGAEEKLAADPAVEAVTPVAIFRHVVTGLGEGYTDVNVIAYRAGGVVRPDVVRGREAQREGEALADERLGAGVGTRLRLAGRDVTVTGLVRGITYNGGTPTLLVTLAQGQQVAYDGEPLASAFVVRGQPATAPPGLVLMTPTEVRDDLRRPLSVATGALALVSVLLWVVAGGIVAMICYLSGLDRHRDLAVFKAFGVSDATLLAGLLLQGVLVGALAGVLALGLAWLIAPAFPVEVRLGWVEAVGLVGLALVLGAAASAASARGPLRVDPVEAFAAS